MKHVIILIAVVMLLIPNIVTAESFGYIAPVFEDIDGTKYFPVDEVVLENGGRKEISAESVKLIFDESVIEIPVSLPAVTVSIDNEEKALENGIFELDISGFYVLYAPDYLFTLAGLEKPETNNYIELKNYYPDSPGSKTIITFDTTSNTLRSTMLITLLTIILSGCLFLIVTSKRKRVSY
jgi:hypothetical protein